MTITQSLQAALFSLSALLTGCIAGPQPMAGGTRPPALFQLDDHSWADLSDAREIYFSPAGGNDGSDMPARIFIVHPGGGENTFSFTFDNEPSAIAAWKRLVNHLGGSLSDETVTKRPTAELTAIAASPVATHDGKRSLSSTNPYVNFRNDLDELTACRDDKLITQEEYDRGHDRTVSNFIFITKRNTPYGQTCVELRNELVQLETAKKDHLIGDADEKELHEAILVRHNLASQ